MGQSASGFSLDVREDRRRHALLFLVGGPALGVLLFLDLTTSFGQPWSTVLRFAPSVLLAVLITLRERIAVTPRHHRVLTLAVFVGAVLLSVLTARLLDVSMTVGDAAENSVPAAAAVVLAALLPPILAGTHLLRGRR